jgi:hypothetical protein
MPIQLRPKARAETVRSRRHGTIEAVDWLAFWGLSLGFCAIVLAALTDFVGHDNFGAAFILAGAAGIVALILWADTKPAGPG